MVLGSFAMAFNDGCRIAGRDAGAAAARFGLPDARLNGGPAYLAAQDSLRAEPRAVHPVRRADPYVDERQARTSQNLLLQRENAPNRGYRRPRRLAGGFIPSARAASAAGGITAGRDGLSPHR
jgi:hypothetical protein